MAALPRSVINSVLGVLVVCGVQPLASSSTFASQSCSAGFIQYFALQSCSVDFIQYFASQ